MEFNLLMSDHLLIFWQDGSFNIDKMTSEQKSAYLEAHMEVQQHMQQVSMQLNKQMTAQLNSGNLSLHGNSSAGLSSSSSLHLPNQYSSSSSLKVGSCGDFRAKSEYTLMSIYSHEHEKQVPQMNSTSSSVENTFTVPDDGMGYESGVRVLQSLGNWSPDIPPNVPRPNLIPFIEPYIEGGSMHPASRLKALQQVQQASQGVRKTTPSKCKPNYYETFY